jgi:GntR family transcriptional regulator
VKIDESSPEHSYLQLARLLRERIVSGDIVSQLPSITELTEDTGLAVGTVRRAIRVLIDDGLVHTVPGRGTYVVGGVRATAGSGGGREGPSGPKPVRGGAADPGRPHGHVRH